MRKSTVANGHMAHLNAAARKAFGNLSSPFGDVVCIIVSEEVGTDTFETDSG